MTAKAKGVKPPVDRPKIFVRGVRRSCEIMER